MNPFTELSAHQRLLQAQAWVEAGRWTQAWSMLQTLKPEELGTSAAAAYWVCLGRCLGVSGRVREALSAFDRALQAQPSCVDALVGRATAWALLGEHGHSGRDATAALQHQAEQADALQLQANAFVKVGQPALALAAFERLERLCPGAPFVAGMRVFLARRLALWQTQGLPLTAQEAQAVQQQDGLTPTRGAPAGAGGCDEDLARLRHRLMAGLPTLEPFAALTLFDDPALQRTAAQAWLQRWPLQTAWPVPTPAPPPSSFSAAGTVGGPVRVAYLSSDFYNHATAWLLAGVLEQHSARRVKVWLISYGLPKDDEMTRRLKAMGHEWVDARSWADEQVARYCQQQGVQIAVDLKGLTQDGRPGIFSYRAAPVQVNWLGYPGTLPAPYYDYVLADRQVLPAPLRPHFAENVVYLPHSYQPNDHRRPIAPMPGTRAEQRGQHGLPAQALVLCSFNATVKISPPVWAVWMRVLLAAPQTVLWLLADEHARENLRGHAASAGVDPARLVFASHLPQAVHLARLALADLSLDTLPYGAHTTASDALLAGVPHLSCAGASFASRVGASVLHAAGLPDLVTESLAGYEARAQELVRQPWALTALKGALTGRRGSCALFDAPAFAGHLEAAFEGMWRRCAAGQAPQDFEVV